MIVRDGNVELWHGCNMHVLNGYSRARLTLAVVDNGLLCLTSNYRRLDTRQQAGTLRAGYRLRIAHMTTYVLVQHGR